MPAGQAWQDGARPGMRVVSLNGRSAPAALDVQPLENAELLAPNGQIIVARLMTVARGSAWTRRALWLTGALFALLGAVVLVRRPDAAVARLFGLFTGLTGVALGVSPAASGPQPAWSLIVQFLSLLGLAASLPAFATAFVGDWRGPRNALRRFWLAGGILLAGYLAALFIHPSAYSVVRTGFAIYFVTGVLAALAVLARKALVRQAARSVHDARLALTGIACGTLPFMGFTLIPLIALHHDLVPARVTAVLWGAIPLTFAYAILRHQALGIRRLVHRGMVYGATTAVLLAVMSLLVVAAGSMVDGFPGGARPTLIIAGLLALGVFLLHFLSRGMRRLVDRAFYTEQLDSGTLLAAMRHDLLGSEQADEVVPAMVKRLQDSLRLEAAVLFLGTTEETLRVAASSGPRADECAPFVRPRLLDLAFGERGVSETRWSSDHLLVARLEAGIDTLGYLVLGPKEQGEIFLGEEQRLVETVAPILALAIRETSLVAELRDVSERLTNAQEAERGRIARDLHDGPLQKAILLGGVADTTLRDRDRVARELAAELRELCARLRPAILDDLGLVPALEWLLEQTAQGFKVTPHLTLRGMTEDDRLAPGAELALFRVTQEAVSNALKHSRATSIHVSLIRTISSVELSVTDDGYGPPIAGDLGRGLGIPGMRERLRQVGGSVSVGSNGGTGTMVSARIPYTVHGEQ
ncbi:MAG TPA: GAF domain-containing sensor histidine kinase [Candidatus Polarisedimenticolia bacterium]|nr:GAF domain-containing sensor histidine kinase [Candidatus Polarisedimenticolia bacterium]